MKAHIELYRTPFTPSATPEIDSILRCGKPLKRGKYREVWRFENFILKITKTPGIARKIKLTLLKGKREGEVRNACRLIDMGLNVPKPVAWGIRKRGVFVENVFYLFEYVDGRHPEDEDIEKIASLLGKLSRMNIYLLDPHPSNFLVNDNGIWILDTYYVTWSSFGKLKEKEALAKLIEPLVTGCKQEALTRAIRAYNLESGRKFSIHDIVKSLKKRMIKKSRNSRKIYKDKPNPPKLEDLSHGELIKKSSKSETFRINGIVAKSSKSFFLLKTRGEKAWDGLRILKRHGIPCPEAVYLKKDLRFPWKRVTVYMEYIEGKELEKITTADWESMGFNDKKAIMERLAKLLSSLYTKCVFHSDLKGRNIIVFREKLYVIDPEAVTAKPISTKEVIKNLAQLEKSSVGVSLTWKVRLLKALFPCLSIIGVTKGDFKKWIKDVTKGVKAQLNQ